MSDSTVTVETLPCPLCGKSSIMTINREQFERWQAGEHIQNAFPEMEARHREMLLTGCHPACWDEMWKEEEDGQEG